MLLALRRLGFVDIADDGGTLRFTETGRELYRARCFFSATLGGYGRLFQNLHRLAGASPEVALTYRDDAAVAKACAQRRESQGAQLLREILRSLPYTCIADIGCGDGNFVVQACRDRIGSRGIGIDLSEAALSSAAGVVAGSGMASRISLVQGDASRLEQLAEPGAPLAEADLVASFFMLHHLLNQESARPAEARGETLRAWRRAFPRARWFLVADHVQTESGHESAAPVWSLAFELIHAFVDVRVPTQRELEQSFSAAGLRIAQRWEYGHPSEWLYVLEAGDG
jgi:SAM-dependent methyltransferase